MAGRPGPLPPIGGFAGDLNGGVCSSSSAETGSGPRRAGLALLESGLPPSDPAVANIERGLRSGHSAPGPPTISLLIMFFDWLGRKEDTR